MTDDALVAKRGSEVPAEAMAELEDWIARKPGEAGEKALLNALAMFEAFTGQIALEEEREQQVDGSANWQVLLGCPVQAVFAETGQIDIDSSGSGLVKASSPQTVRYRVGMATQWLQLPEGARHGIIRLAAHQCRLPAETTCEEPPLAVAALWRPWRRVRSV